MGVPRLFPYIIQNFPSAHTIIKKFKYKFQQQSSSLKSSTFKEVGAFFKVDSPTSTTFTSKDPYILEVDNLFLDSNPFLHNAAQIIFAYQDGKRNLPMPYDNEPFEVKCKLVYELFFKDIMEILTFVRPKKILYIALDGPAPWAKITQQRERRFKSAFLRSSSKESTPFDSNNITPGTSLMSDLTRYINTMIRVVMNKKNNPFPPNVIFSPSNVPGEGEHKLISFLRDNMKTMEKERSCIYGPDADLIMLALATHVENFFVIRPDMKDKKDVRHILTFSNISYYLPLILRKEKITVRQRWTVCDDFILMGFFVGNDFLPKIQMFLYLEDGLDYLLHYYKFIGTITYWDKTSKRHLINMDVFTTLVGYLYDGEEKELVKSLKRPLKDPAKDEMFKNHTLQRNVKNGVLDFNNYRKEYYLKAHLETEEEIEKMCIDYVRGMFWVLQYYLDGVQSWNYSYQYHYPPLMKDLYRVLKKNQEKPLEEREIFDNYEMDSPLYPFEQLLAVLPQSSINLLPEQYQILMKESPLVEKGYYNEDFLIDYEGKTDEFMGIVLISFIDRNTIREQYKLLTDTLNIYYHRNTIGRDALFYQDFSTETSYTSKYGDIKSLYVRKKLI